MSRSGRQPRQASRLDRAVRNRSIGSCGPGDLQRIENPEFFLDQFVDAGPGGMIRRHVQVGGLVGEKPHAREAILKSAHPGRDAWSSENGEEEAVDVGRDGTGFGVVTGCDGLVHGPGPRGI